MNIDNKTELEKKVENVLKRIKPIIQMDGGDIELVKVEEDSGKVYVKLSGACHGCPASAMTLQFGVMRALKQSIPEITEVLTV